MNVLMPVGTVEAVKLSQFFPETEEDRTVHMEIHRKSVAIAVAYALELSESFLVNLEGLNEAAPHNCDQLTRMMMGLIDTFHKSIMINQNIKSVLWKSEKYLQLVDKGEALHEQIVSEDRAEQEKAEEVLRRARTQANVDAWRLKESKRVEAAAAVEEATTTTVQSSDQSQVMPLLMELVRETQFPSADKKVSDERSADAAEKDKDVEEEAAAIKRAEKKKAKRIKRQAASEVAAGKAEAKQAADKEAAKKKIAAEKAAIDNDKADKKAKAAEKVAALEAKGGY